MDPLSFNGIIQSLEGLAIGEKRRLYSLADRFSELEGYEIINLEDIADRFNIAEQDLYGYSFDEDPILPGIQDTDAEYFILEAGRVDELTQRNSYEAAFAEGRIEVRDEDLWDNQEFRDTVYSWEDWRSNQSILGLKPSDLRIYKEF